MAGILICLPAAFANSPPQWKFRVIKSTHFEVIYREEQKPLAQRYALAAEQAYELLMPIFKEGPDNTIIFLSDDSDNSNGLASFLPYPMITVFPVLPSTLDSIDDFGDWPLEMIVHEYTHILNMYPAHGIYIPLKYLFGGVIRPNAVLPTWYLEGLAVDLESHLTDHGRLRAIETQATARALVLSDHLHKEDIAIINEQELTTWPFGNRPYVFGGWWWNNVHTQYSSSVIETWNQNFSRRLPFLLNGPMQEQTQKTAVGLLDSMADNVEATARRELKSLNDSKPHTSSAVADEPGGQSVFAVSPSGDKLVYFVSRPIVGTEAKLKNRSFPTEPFATIKGLRLFKSIGTLRVRWIDDNHFIFDQLDAYRPYVSYRDLYIYDLNTKHVERLTHSQRAQEPAVSPKIDKVAFIKNDGGRNDLMLLTLENLKVSRPPLALVHGKFSQRLSGPEFINDNEIVFAIRVRSGTEKLFVFNLSEHKVHPWNESLLSAQNARFTTKGLLVSDASTHVRNIYLASPGAVPGLALTNTLTHIETSDYDPQRNEILFSEMTADGRKLRSIPFATYSPVPIDPVKIEPPPLAKTTKVKVTEESYQPLAYLWPRYWIPFLYSVENGGWLLQGATANSDPAGRNTYSIAGSYDTITKKPSYGLNYVNSSLPTDIGMSYGRSVTYLGASNRIVESQAGALNLANTWPFNNRFIKWNVGGQMSETKGTQVYRRSGPGGGITYSRLEHPLNTGAGFVAELTHQEYLSQPNYTAYGRTYAHGAMTFNVFGANKILFQVRGALAPKMPFNDVLDLGDRNVGANYLVNLANSDFLLRGYPSGTFVGRKILNANLEFALPVFELAKGAGTFPMFMKSMEVAVFADAMSVDGGGYRPDLGNYHRTGLKDYFMGTGAELRLNTTAGYHLPVGFILGAYYGLNQQYGGGFTPFFGLGLGDLAALQDKTP